ncbi:MAG: carbohydrate ABC transporter permease [Anaerolineaceae bacterium]|nr:MAG: carbohydrate ABC transporter permease [Anaerolineaceae bacterium]
MQTNQLNEKLKRESRKEKRKDFILMLIALGIVVIMLFPVYWMAITSVKSDHEIFAKVLTFIPKDITFEPWLVQFRDRNFLYSLRNSIVIAFTAMTLSLSLGITAAYGLGKYKLPFHNSILLVFLVTQMMPSSLLLTPLYLFFARTSLLNTFLAPAMAIATNSIPFIIITLRPYFMSVPKSLDEAARIDGSSAFRSFIQIVIPAVKTGVITVMVISFLHGWNDLVYSMTFNVEATMRPLTANIHKFMDQYGMKWNNIMAYGMILAIPVLTSFVFLQKHIIGGVTSGAVKE